MTLEEIPGLLFFLLVGVILSAYGLFLRLKIKQAKGWPIVKGRITKSILSSGLKRTRGFKYSYISEPIIEYKYLVDETCYEGTQIALIVLNAASAKRAQKMLNKYPEGAYVDIHFNPAKPAEAVLEFSNEETVAKVIICIGIIVLLSTFCSYLFM